MLKANEVIGKMVENERIIKFIEEDILEKAELGIRDLRYENGGYGGIGKNEDLKLNYVLKHKHDFEKAGFKLSISKDYYRGVDGNGAIDKSSSWDVVRISW